MNVEAGSLLNAKYLLMEDKHLYIIFQKVKMVMRSGKRVYISVLLCGFLEIYRPLLSAFHWHGKHKRLHIILPSLFPNNEFKTTKA